MIKRFGRNMLHLLFWTALAIFALGAVVLLLIFGFSLIEHFTANNDQGFGQSLEDDRPAILWWALAAGLGAAVAAVATYSIASDQEEYFYCPNCTCPSCTEEKRQRALDDVTAAAMAGGLAGGMAGGNIGNSS